MNHCVGSITESKKNPTEIVFGTCFFYDYYLFIQWLWNWFWQQDCACSTWCCVQGFAWVVTNLRAELGLSAALQSWSQIKAFPSCKDLKHVFFFYFAILCHRHQEHFNWSIFLCARWNQSNKNTTLKRWNDWKGHSKLHEEAPCNTLIKVHLLLPVHCPVIATLRFPQQWR